MKKVVSQFQLDYEMYLGSRFTPSGKINPVPNNSWLAYRYAVDEYRKRSKEVKMDSLELDMLSTIDDPRSTAEGMMARHHINSSYTPEPDSEQIVNYNELVEKILSALEKKSKDKDLCRYFATMIYQLDGLDILKDELRSKIEKYLEDVNLDKVGKFDRDIAEALSFRVESGSQSRKLVSVKKRLADRVRVLGITRIDIFGM